MKVKNITGHKGIFNLGRFSTELENNAIWVLPDDDALVYRDARRYDAAGYIEIVEGPGFKQSLASRTLPAHGTITFSGGGTDGKIITIGDTVFELDDDASVTAGRVLVDVSDGTAADSAAALAAAINATDSCQVKATVIAEVVYVYHKTNGQDGSGIALLDDDAAVAVSGATLTDGTYGAALGAVVTTVEAADTGAVIVTGLSDISHVVVSVRTAAGVMVPFTGSTYLTDGVIEVVDDNAEISATDLITVIAFG